MLTVHASGGEEMLSAATSVVKRPHIVGVTVLTSQKSTVTESKVLNLAKLAKKSGVDGIVCSYKEIAAVRKKIGKRFIIVVPGIRPKGSSRGDQKRVATPKKAIEAGADFIVVGRPIVKARNSLKAAEEILQEIK